MLTRVKETLPQDKQSQVVYRIPCSCGKVYTRETFRRLKTRLREHEQVFSEGTTALSTVAEHMHRHQNPITDQARGHQELLLKEAIYIHSAPPGTL